MSDTVDLSSLRVMIELSLILTEWESGSLR
jgi:hypothetical protein